MAAFSPRAKAGDSYPLASPFDLESGKLMPDIWKQWADNDQLLWSQNHREAAKKVFQNRLVLIVGDKDEFGLYETTKAFSEGLDALSIAHLYREIPGAGHTNYLDKQPFVSELWSTLFSLTQ